MTLEELIHRRRRRSPPTDEEHRIQVSCVQWFHRTYPHLRGRLFAVPNGGHRYATTAAKLKAEGVVPGVADLILLKSNHHYGALLIEMKRPKGRQSESQRQWQQLVCSAGEYLYVKCYSLDDFCREIKEYLNHT